MLFGGFHILYPVGGRVFTRHRKKGLSMERTLKIAICDDEQTYLDILEDECLQFLDSRSQQAEISCYQSGGALLASKNEFDIILLDVELPDMDGFSVAEKWKYLQRSGKIIFITSHDEWVQRAFKVQAFRYLYKNGSGQELWEALEDALKDMNDNEGIMLEGKEENRFVYFREIRWIEALGDEIAVFLVGDHLVVRLSLKKIEGCLDERFQRIHKGFIINFQFVEHFYKESLVLKCGKEFQISKRKQKEVKNHYFEYITKYAKVL